MYVRPQAIFVQLKIEASVAKFTSATTLKVSQEELFYARNVKVATEGLIFSRQLRLGPNQYERTIFYTSVSPIMTAKRLFSSSESDDVKNLALILLKSRSKSACQVVINKKFVHIIFDK